MRSKENAQFWKEYDKMPILQQIVLKIITIGGGRSIDDYTIREISKKVLSNGYNSSQDKFIKLLLKDGYIKNVSGNWTPLYVMNSDKISNELFLEIKDEPIFLEVNTFLKNSFKSYMTKDFDDDLFRKMRNVLFLNNNENSDFNFENAYDILGSRFINYMTDSFGEGLENEIFNVINPVFRLTIEKIIFKSNLINLKDNIILATKIESNIEKYSKDNEMLMLLCYYYLFVGNNNKIEFFINKIKEEHLKYEIYGVLSFLKGNNKEAMLHFEKSLSLLSTAKKNLKKHLFPSWGGFFYLLTILSFRDIKMHTSIRELIKKEKKKFIFPSLLTGLESLMLFLENEKVRGQGYIIELLNYYQSTKVVFFFYLIATCGDYKLSNKQLDYIERNGLQAYSVGYQWIALQYLYILKAQNKPNNLLVSKISETNNNISHSYDLLSYFEKEEEWLQALKILEDISNHSNKKEQSEGRISWLVDMKNKIVTPKEQKINKNGTWSVGKNISIRRFKEESVPYSTLQDIKILSCFTLSYGYYSGSNAYSVDFDSACLAMIGHPYLFFDDGTNFEIIKREPELLIEQQKNSDNFLVSLSVSAEKPGIILEKETNTRYKLFQITELHTKVFNNLGKGKLSVPQKGRDLLSKALGSIVNIVNVNSSIANFGIDLPRVEANNQIFALLLPFGNGGLKLELLVKPFTTTAPYLKPGKTPETVIGEINKQKVQAFRNLSVEKSKAKKVIQACEILKINDDNSYEWTFEETEDCLEALYQLEEIKEDIVLEWPEGQKFKIAYKASTANASLHIRKQNDWFDIDAEIRLNETNVIRMAELLEMLDNSKNRFIQMKDGQFLALTETFRKRLQEIKAFTEKTKDGLRFHNLAAWTMDDITKDFENIKTDTSWKNQIKKIKNAQTINPKIPSTLKTELRSYQADGFKWLAQLAEWGVGACLADDMGLGKTIQGLALILHRANQGPTLVVAPATVARNWVAEAAKFAPTMNTILFGGKEREQQMSELADYDLMVCSYGLLQQEAEKFAKVKWTTIILDEAQNIKNMSTKRSKAAMDLQSDFKMITTGTPVENHLGELWNLFRFINAGLLGSLNDFNERYAIQIERNQDVERQKQLQKLLKPFILRRRKSQVLEELPSKTEITLSVEMSKDESAFYEALRMRAVEKLQQSSQAGGVHEGERRLQILAEIMKLRQASCNTKLVLKDSTISSSKLELLLETTEELKENGHKALIFSQFVGHLTLIKEAFEARGYSYKYLDGSTPMKKREEAIKEFQNGEADFFLISLKAGGVGLNLTAADYVIHMDPWWNPAVEDQASDRAHRIGQQRPVTIYRLVTKGTIEEKIVSLHQNKRDLADNLLEGTEMSGKITSDELLNLIKQG
ncbi:MAG: DEAD/DEAH box helicase [Cytophagales bacterium]|nr:MAG: DEAD/DEAH box helicase [Cytophagales bacterium]